MGDYGKRLAINALVSLTLTLTAVLLRLALRQ